MLMELFPRVHGRFLLLQVLGGVVKGFAQWLVDQDYTRTAVRGHVRCTRRLDRLLQQRGCHRLTDITSEGLSTCVPTHARRRADISLAATTRCWHRYLQERGLIAVAPPPASPSRRLLAAYADHLRDVRGLAVLTITAHMRETSRSFFGRSTTTPTRLDCRHSRYEASKSFSTWSVGVRRAARCNTWWHTFAVFFVFLH